jgi:hypothetical protein
MAAICFCGCGSKVKLSRRAFNGTGALVRVQLEAWDERQELYEALGLWRSELQEFVSTGEEMDYELQGIAHGGPVALTHPQKAITAWLLRSRSLLAELEAAEGMSAGAVDAAAEEPPPPTTGTPTAEPPPAPTHPAARAARRAEIEAIRASYESDDGSTACPECGAMFEDQGAYLTHLAAEHG